MYIYIYIYLYVYIYAFVWVCIHRYNKEWNWDALYIVSRHCRGVMRVLHVI